ncbi:MAG TPA: 50S ribosomal protein L21 [Candidatus Saccharimonadia bacterium]
MQAVITTGGKQYLVQADQTLEVDITGDGAKTIAFEPLLVIDGTYVHVGEPVVGNMMVQAAVIGEVKGEKIDVLKFKAKKRVNTKIGHRQRYTQIKIVSIGSSKTAKKPVASS